MMTVTLSCDHRVVDGALGAEFLADAEIHHRRAAEPDAVKLRAARPDDVPTILGFIRLLAAFEREPDAVETTAERLHDALFGATPRRRR